MELLNINNLYIYIHIYLISIHMFLKIVNTQTFTPQIYIFWIQYFSIIILYE